MSVFTKLLQGQEESKQMMKEMQNEITQVTTYIYACSSPTNYPIPSMQQRNMLASLSNTLSTATHTPTLSAEIIIESVKTAFQRAAVSVASVSTQTSNPPELMPLHHGISRATDQAVPMVSLVTECEGRDLYSDTSDSTTTFPSRKQLPQFVSNHEETYIQPHGVQNLHDNCTNSMSLQNLLTEKPAQVSTVAKRVLSQDTPCGM